MDCSGALYPHVENCMGPGAGGARTLCLQGGTACCGKSNQDCAVGGPDVRGCLKEQSTTPLAPSQVTQQELEGLHCGWKREHALALFLQPKGESWELTGLHIKGGGGGGQNM